MRVVALEELVHCSGWKIGLAGNGPRLSVANRVPGTGAIWLETLPELADFAKLKFTFFERLGPESFAAAG